MKLFRFGDIGQEKPGIIIDEKWLNISPYMQDYNESFFENNGGNLGRSP
jgi:2,4-didehydro-3-deoxy-L-rhamnonate hydrolase